MGGWVRSKEDQQPLINICKACSYKQKGRCGKCGCFLSILIKIKNQKCPIDKW